MNKTPYISIIVPVYNGGDQLARCVDALGASDFDSFEVIVVDDSSTDGAASRVKGPRVRVTSVPGSSGPAGPAVARNHGAKEARGEVLLFIDADVVVRPETISRVAAHFKGRGDIAALFGSYDSEPGPRDFLSQYRNMVHHFHHQRSDPEASTFWAGCGAIRRKVFDDLEGFNHRLYRRPSIEDIELGYRARMKGYRILLDRDIQVKHLKSWGFVNMLRTDIFQRALPWSRLIMESKFIPDSLNLKTGEMASSLVVALMLLALPLLAFWKTPVAGVSLAAWAGAAEAALFAVLLLLNREFYGFFLRSRGLWFTIRVIPMHILYYIYSGLSFAFSWVTYKVPALAPLYKIVVG